MGTPRESSNTCPPVHPRVSQVSPEFLELNYSYSKYNKILGCLVYSSIAFITVIPVFSQIMERLFMSLNNNNNKNEPRCAVTRERYVLYLELFK